MGAMGEWLPVVVASPGSDVCFVGCVPDVPQWPPRGPPTTAALGGQLLLERRDAWHPWHLKTDGRVS